MEGKLGQRPFQSRKSRLVNFASDSSSATFFWSGSVCLGFGSKKQIFFCEQESWLVYVREIGRWLGFNYRWSQVFLLPPLPPKIRPGPLSHFKGYLYFVAFRRCWQKIAFFLIFWCSLHRRSLLGLPWLLRFGVAWYSYIHRGDSLGGEGKVYLWYSIAVWVPSMVLGRDWLSGFGPDFFTIIMFGDMHGSWISRVHRSPPGKADDMYVGFILLFSSQLVFGVCGKDTSEWLYETFFFVYTKCLWVSLSDHILLVRFPLQLFVRYVKSRSMGRERSGVFWLS